MLKINGVLMPAPTEYTPGIMDLDSGKTMRLVGNGKMVRRRIAVKRKLEFTWGILTIAEAQTILTAVSPVMFSVEYEDPQTGGSTTGTFYVSDRTLSAVGYSGGKITAWKGLKFSFTEE